MFERLKSLPLTILLTLLIWAYAEAQFTSTQQDVPINVRVASNSPDYALRVMDPVTKRFSNILNFIVTLQGPRNQIDQILQESQGASRDKSGEDHLGALTYIPTTDQLRQAVASGGSTSGGSERENGAATADGEGLHPAVIPMLNRLEYFRSRGVTVTFANPSYVNIEVDTVTRLRKDAAFQSAVAVENATVDPATVEVQIPSQSLLRHRRGQDRRPCRPPE